MALVKADQTPGLPKKKPGDVTDSAGVILRDRWSRPLIVPAAGRPAKPYTRASTLGSTLEDQSNIGEWKKRVVAFGLARRRDLILAAASVPSWEGPQNKKQLSEIAEQAMQAAEANAAATIGTALHALTDRLDRGEPIPDVGDDQRALDAYAQLMRGFRVHAIELFLACDELEVAGTTDRVLSPREVMTAPDGTRITPDDRLISDTKTAATSDFFGIKFAVQLGGGYANGEPYIGGEDLEIRAAQEAAGINPYTMKAMLERVRGERPGWPDGIAPRTDWGWIVHVPSGGSTATLHWVNLTLGWELAKLAVQVREWRKRKDLVVPAAPPRVPLSPALANGGLMSLIDAEPDGPDLRERLLRLWSQHSKAWTPAHTARVTERLGGS